MRSLFMAGVLTTASVAHAETNKSGGNPLPTPRQDCSCTCPCAPAGTPCLPCGAAEPAPSPIDFQGTDVLALETSGLLLSSIGISAHVFSIGAALTGEDYILPYDGATAMQFSMIGNHLTGAGVSIDARRLTEAGRSPRRALGWAALGVSGGGYSLYAIPAAPTAMRLGLDGHHVLWGVSVASQMVSYGLGIAGIVDNERARRGDASLADELGVDLAPMWLEDGGGVALTGRW